MCNSQLCKENFISISHSIVIHGGQKQTNGSDHRECNNNNVLRLLLLLFVCLLEESPKNFDDEANPQGYLSIRVIKSRTADQVGLLKEISPFPMKLIP
jgi:hypothetical protein